MVVGIATRNEEGVVKAVVLAGLWQWEMQHEMWKVLCLLVGEGTIEQLVDSVVDGGGKYSGELCKLVCSCQLMAVVVTQWQWEMQHEMWKQLCILLSMAVSKIEHSGNGKCNMHTDRWSSRAN